MESFKRPASRAEVLGGRVLFSFITLCVVLSIPFGLFSFFTGEWDALFIPLFFCMFWFFLSSVFYIPIEIEKTHLVVAFLIWTLRLPFKKISKIRVTSYSFQTPFRLQAKQCESITIWFEARFIKRIRFVRQPKKNGLGDYLIERLRGINSNVKIEIR